MFRGSHLRFASDGQARPRFVSGMQAGFGVVFSTFIIEHKYIFILYVAMAIVCENSKKMRILSLQYLNMNWPIFSKEYFMQEALKEAEKAFARDEVPVGAVVVSGNRIVGRGFNQTESLNDVTAHAEMLAFTSASGTLNSKYLEECTLYVTLEPCVMCAGASFWTQIGEIVYGAADPKRGFSLVSPSPLHPVTRITAGVLEKECAMLLKEFFKRKR